MGVFGGGPMSTPPTSDGRLMIAVRARVVGRRVYVTLVASFLPSRSDLGRH